VILAEWVESIRFFRAANCGVETDGGCSKNIQKFQTIDKVLIRLARVYDFSTSYWRLEEDCHVGFASSQRQGVGSFE
jgi:hypothetical protein